MKLYAQDGYGPGDKVQAGLADELIDGAILSARYRHPDRFAEKADELIPFGSDLLLDPEYYAVASMGSPNAKLGSLEEWDYFIAPRRSTMITGAAVSPIIRSAIESQLRFNHLTSLIAPNIYIESANSIDAAIALNFINQTKPVADEIGVGDKSVFASLVLDRDVLAEGQAFTDLLSALTGLVTPPDGFYILIGSGSADDGRHIRSDLHHDHVIAGWMMINYVLSINGFRVINGCSDILSPLLGICGAFAGSSGWSSSLRQFTMRRYVKPPSQGGSAPVIKYVSNALLSRVKQTEFDDYRAVCPQVANGLASDAYYDIETSRTQEALQTWGAIKSLSDSSITGDIAADLMSFDETINEAERLWNLIAGTGLSAGVEAHLERLRAMRSGIRMFSEWAELT